MDSICRLKVRRDNGAIEYRPTRAMTFLKLLPAALALALLGAHFWRAQQWLLVALTAALFALFFVKRPAAARVLQVALVAGALEWIRTLAMFALQREAMGQPWTRLALILGGVALFTGLCALVFETRAARTRFGRALPPPAAP
jgi:hypothetical protein